MPRPDKQPPHNPKVPPLFDNGDAEEPLKNPRHEKPASPAGDARTGSHRGEVGNDNSRDKPPGADGNPK